MTRWPWEHSDPVTRLRVCRVKLELLLFQNSWEFLTGFPSNIHLSASDHRHPSLPSVIKLSTCIYLWTWQTAEKQWHKNLSQHYCGMWTASTWMKSIKLHITKKTGSQSWPDDPDLGVIGLFGQMETARNLGPHFPKSIFSGFRHFPASLSVIAKCSPRPSNDVKAEQQIH